MTGFWTEWLGLGARPGDLSALQMSARAVVIFVSGLVMVRIASKRFFARKSAFDIILSFVLASLLARAINGSAALVPTIVTGFVLVLFHRLLAWISVRNPRFSCLIKGHETILVRDGRIQPEALRRVEVSEGDLLEDLRLEEVASPDQVAVARLERSGEISVIKKHQPG